jgi:predicted dehydrogenase
MAADKRAAVIGYGLGGRVFHAPLIEAADGLELAAVVTSHPARQAQVEASHPGAEVLAGIEELWARADELDLVAITTPNEAHVPLAAVALERGLAVVVDKPLAVSADAAAALIEQAERSGGLLTVFQNRRWDSDQLTLRRLLEEDRLGEVIRYESRFERWRPSLSEAAWRDELTPDAGGGQLLDLGSHLVDQALTLFGPASAVFGEVQARRGGPADDDAFIALRHTSGVSSHLHMSAITGAPGPRLRVLGTKGAFVISELDGQEDRLAAGDLPQDVPEWGAEPEAHWGEFVTGDTRERVRSERGDWPRFYNLVASALRGEGPLPVDPRDSLRALRVIEAARESSATRALIAPRDE